MLMTDFSIVTPDRGSARDYIASMAGELAELAREGGDRRLALVLDLAANFADIRPFDPDSPDS